MRTAFAHRAVLAMDDDADIGAPGAAITTLLCGHWKHEPPCPLAPHRTAACRTGDGYVELRVLFATAAPNEALVRSRIEEALATGRVSEPHEGRTSWRLLDSAPVELTTADTEHAERLRRA